MTVEQRETEIASLKEKYQIGKITLDDLIYGVALVTFNYHKDTHHKDNLIAAIKRRIEDLDPQDVDGHIWYNKFLQLIDEFL